MLYVAMGKKGEPLELTWRLANVKCRATVYVSVRALDGAADGVACVISIITRLSIFYQLRRHVV